MTNKLVPTRNIAKSGEIFSIKNEQGLSDIYFSYKNEKGDWTSAINLGAKINTPREDFGPSLSPDNKYFFYTNCGKLKWISTEFLSSLKKSN